MALRRSLRCRAGWVVVSLGVAATLGCGSPGRKFPARPSLLEPAEPAAGASSSTTEWRYHPRRAARIEREYPLAEGRKLLVGGGERWLVDGKHAWPAPMLAPEPLIGALTSKRSAWVFVGRSGTTYEADSPMGALGASSAPLVEMAKVDSGQNDVLGVSRDGELWLSDDAGLGWHAVGPAGVEFADVLVAPPYALALAVPERFWLSKDEGRTWQGLDQPPFGARALARDEDSGPVAVSVLGIRALGFGSDLQVSPLQRTLKPAEPSLASPPILWPSAKAIARGRAYDKAGRYFELSLGVKAEAFAGLSGGELERHPAPLFSSCNDARVAGFERWVYVACTRERGGSSQHFEFFRSEDGGASFEREGYAARGDPELLELAVGAAGVMLVTGLCAPGENVPGCRPQGIFRRVEEADAGAAVTLLPVAAPALEEHARGLVFSFDGRTAYAVGPRTKSDALFAFVSTDLARGFSVRPIEALDDSESRAQSDPVQLTASDEGQLSLVLAQPSGAQRLVVLDASARTVSVNSAPVDAAVIGAYGNRALAVSPENVWESLNGGAEWDNLGRLPRSICAVASGRCSIAVHCTADGCTLGDSLSRIGWRGREAPSALLAPPSAARPNANTRHSLAPAWSCELLNGEWAELRGVERLPDAGQAWLGKAAWFALSTDDATAAAGLYIADAGRASRDVEVRYSELLAPAARPSEVAFQATLQVEGAAALRFRVPAAPAAAPSLGDIEVAWDNLLESQHRRAVIADAGPALPGDFVRGDGPARRAQPDLLSIASGGIFVRVHRQPQQDQVSYFLNGSSVEPWPALRWALMPPKDVSLEMVRLSGESVHLAFVDQGATIVRGRRRGNAWQFDAMSVGYADPGSFSIEQHRDIAYAKGHAGIHLTTRRSDGTTQSELFPLQLEGPVLAAPSEVPTQKDLGDALVPCTAQQRAETPRMVAPQHTGRRRPLLVRDAVEPVRVMLTDSAVLHGSTQSPCVDGFDAELVKTAPSAVARERALLSLDGPSWLFRLVPDNSRRDTRFEYRSMNCRPDAGAELPAEIYDMAGTNQSD